MLQHTYELQDGPRAPRFEEYEPEATAEYGRLLSSSDVAESDLQRFLERNPCFVPGAWTPGIPSGHWPLHCALISQPELPGLKSRRPDFMWIATHSGAWYPTLIEIEQPNKRIFKAGAVPTHEFTQARNQLAQWRVWFSEPTNMQKFVGDYGVPDHFTKFRKAQPHFVLIYGRRTEFDGDVELSRQRGALMPANDEELISFDRLCADPKLSDAVTVHAVGNDRFRVLSAMPTIRLGPADAGRLARLDALLETLENDPRIPRDRAEFLKKRIPYWAEWSKTNPGVIATGDRE